MGRRYLHWYLIYYSKEEYWKIPEVQRFTRKLKLERISDTTN